MQLSQERLSKAKRAPPADRFRDRPLRVPLEVLEHILDACFEQAASTQALKIIIGG